MGDNEHPSDSPAPAFSALGAGLVSAVFVYLRVGLKAQAHQRESHFSGVFAGGVFFLACAYAFFLSLRAMAARDTLVEAEGDGLRSVLRLFALLLALAGCIFALWAMHWAQRHGF